MSYIYLQPNLVSDIPLKRSLGIPARIGDGGGSHSPRCFSLRKPDNLRLGGPLMLMYDFPFTFVRKEYNDALYCIILSSFATAEVYS